MISHRNKKDLEEFGTYLEKLLRECGLTQEKAGVQSTVSRIKNGKSDPKFSTLNNIAKNTKKMLCKLMCYETGGCPYEKDNEERQVKGKGDE